MTHLLRRSAERAVCGSKATPRVLLRHAAAHVANYGLILCPGCVDGLTPEELRAHRKGIVDRTLFARDAEFAEAVNAGRARQLELGGVEP